MCMDVTFSKSDACEVQIVFSKIPVKMSVFRSSCPNQFSICVWSVSLSLTGL